MSKKTYSEKLRDPRWQKKRLEVLEEAEWTCEYCGATDKPFHVHHGYYERGFSPWDYPIDTLHCLCEDCHDQVGKLTAEIHRGIAQLSMKELYRMREIIRSLVDDFSLPYEPAIMQYGLIAGATLVHDGVPKRVVANLANVLAKKNLNENTVYDAVTKLLNGAQRRRG